MPGHIPAGLDELRGYTTLSSTPRSDTPALGSQYARDRADLDVGEDEVVANVNRVRWLLTEHHDWDAVPTTEEVIDAKMKARDVRLEGV